MNLHFISKGINQQLCSNNLGTPQSSIFVQLIFKYSASVRSNIHTL